MQISLFEDDDNADAQVVNVASVPQRSPFRYPGGKTWFIPRLRQWLYSLSATPTLLVEPFAGGGIVALTTAFERLAQSVLLVELDAEVAAVWQTVVAGNAPHHDLRQCGRSKRPCDKAWLYGKAHPDEEHPSRRNDRTGHWQRSGVDDRGEASDRTQGGLHGKTAISLKLGTVSTSHFIKFHQYPKRTTRVNKGVAGAVVALDGLGVDEFDPLCCQIFQHGINIRHLQAQMMHARAVLGQPFGNAGIHADGLHQLDVTVAHR